MAADKDTTTSSSSDSEVEQKPAAPVKKEVDTSSDSDSDVKPAAPAKKAETSSDSDSSDSKSDKKEEKKAETSSDSDSSDSESDKKDKKKEESSSDSSDSESDKKPAKKEETSSDSDSSDSESDKKPAKKEESSSDSDSDSDDKKIVTKAAKKSKKSKQSDSSDSDSESEEKKKESSDDDEEEEEKPKKFGGLQGWLEQRRIKKREQDNIEFSKKVVKDWKYNRDGALAKKVCYEGMLPYTRIMSWSTMIGRETRITSKLYRVNVKNGANLRDKFAANPNAPTEGNEKTVIQIPNGVKEVYPNESSFHTADFEKSLQQLLETWVAYRPDIGYFDGLNFVAAMVLQFQDAESAFTSTVNLFSEYIVDAVDPERKADFKDYCTAFESALGEEVPEVASYFSDKEVESAVILRDWMCSLFTRCVSFEKAKRLWDILLLEGEFGLVKISCGILKYYQEEITDMSPEKIYAFLKHLPEKVNIDKIAQSIKSIQLAQVDFDLLMQSAKEAHEDDTPEPADSDDEKPAKKIESDSEDEKPAKKEIESSDSDSDSDVKMVTTKAAKKVVSSSDSSSEDEKPAPKKVESSSSDSSDDEKPAPKPAPKAESSSSDSSSSEDEKPAPKPAPKKVETSSSSDSSSDDEKPAPKPAPKKVETSSSSDSSSDDEKPAPKPAPKKVETSSDSSSD